MTSAQENRYYKGRGKAHDGETRDSPRGLEGVSELGSLGLLPLLPQLLALPLLPLVHLLEST